jgi:hypothetical protein
MAYAMPATNTSKLAVPGSGITTKFVLNDATRFVVGSKTTDSTPN